MRKNVVDERVKRIRNQIAYEALTILLTLLAIAIALQMTIFKMPWSAYVVEAFGLVLAGGYVVVRMLFNGIRIFDGRYEKKFPTIVYAGVDWFKCLSELPPLPAFLPGKSNWLLYCGDRNPFY